MITAAFGRSIHKTSHCHSHNIGSNEYFCTDNNGHGAIITAGEGSSATPPDFLLMALGACLSNGIKFYIGKRGKKISNLDIDVIGEWSTKPCYRISDIKLKITAETDVDKETFAKIVNEAEEKMCPVSGTLRYSPKITSTVEIK